VPLSSALGGTYLGGVPFSKAFALHIIKWFYSVKTCSNSSFSVIPSPEKEKKMPDISKNGAFHFPKYPANSRGNTTLGKVGRSYYTQKIGTGLHILLKI
jgi:hypothetical protein